MPDIARQRPPHYWERYTDGDGSWSKKEGPAGADLAALRRGIGREPGTVAQMWPYYTTLNDEGEMTGELRAEHTALTLYAVHQQSRPRPMHITGIGLGRAVRALHSGEHGKFSQEAVNRRFAAAATATSPAELAMHLRGLIAQLHTIGHGLDYSQLCRDLVDWQDADRVGRVRRRWGRDYFIWKAEPDAAANEVHPDEHTSET